MLKKFKDIVKKNPEPTKGKFGINPMDPWSVKYGIAEATDKNDTVILNIPLLIRVLELAREDIKTDMDLHRVVEKLINIRKKGVLTMKDYNTIAHIKENHIAIAMGKMLDDEGSMVLDQLEQLERACAMIRTYVGKDYEKQLPAWVQSKITLATDYIDTAGNYLSSKNEKVTEDKDPCWTGYTQVGMKKKGGRDVPNCVPSKGVPKAKGYKEETELDEAQSKRMSSADKFRKFMANRDKQHTEFMKGIEGKSHAEKMQAMMDKIKSNLNKEEVENLDESDPLKNRQDYAKRHGTGQVYKKTHPGDKTGMTQSFAYDIKRTGPKGKLPEEVVNELSNELLGSYKKKAGEQASAADKAGDFKKGNKRFSGIVRATKKQFANDVKEAAQHDPWKQKHFGPHTVVSNRKMTDKEKTEWEAHKKWKQGAADALASDMNRINKEEVEAIGELNTNTLKDYLNKSTEVRKSAKSDLKDIEKRPEMYKNNTDKAQQNIASQAKKLKDTITKRTMGANRAFNRLHGEEVNKKEMSKSARMIKSLYKKHNMTEDMTDWEKEDKSVQTYGKKPKIQTTPKESSFGEDKPKAAIIMSGGKTMTGQTRDTVEIDPMLKKRPGPDDFDRNYGKKQPQ